jgi:hypothetical protein
MIPDPIPQASGSLRLTTVRPFAARIRAFFAGAELGHVLVVDVWRGRCE